MKGMTSWINKLYAKGDVKSCPKILPVKSKIREMGRVSSKTRSNTLTNSSVQGSNILVNQNISAAKT